MSTADELAFINFRGKGFGWEERFPKYGRQGMSETMPLIYFQPLKQSPVCGIQYVSSRCYRFVAALYFVSEVKVGGLSNLVLLRSAGVAGGEDFAGVVVIVVQCRSSPLKKGYQYLDETSISSSNHLRHPLLRFLSF